MSKLKVGFGSVVINPEMGAPLFGYYVPRFAKGILDDLTASALALKVDNKTVVMISVDNCGLNRAFVERASEEIFKNTGISKNNLFISSTHTHTAPFAQMGDAFEMDEAVVKRYADFLVLKLVEAVKIALSDFKEAKVGFAIGRAPDRIAYIRRYKMKDGSTMTCPPVNDPNIDYPLGTLDTRVNVVRIDREEGESIILVNYGLHADTIGGELISADWIHWVKKTLDLSLGGVHTMCFVGAQGDVGSTNVYPTKSDMNDTEISFDNEMKSPGMARFVGRALAGTVLQLYDKVEYMDEVDIDIVERVLRVPANLPKKEDMPRAREYKALHDSGRDDLIPFEAMELTTVVAEAIRMCRMENGPEYYDLHFSGVKIGSIAFIGIPGEPFTEIGVAIKKIPGWDMICPTINTNGKEGYFPSLSAFDEGGYEARTSPYTRTVCEDIVACSKEILDTLAKC